MRQEVIAESSRNRTLRTSAKRSSDSCPRGCSLVSFILWLFRSRIPQLRHAPRGIIDNPVSASLSLEGGFVSQNLL